MSKIFVEPVGVTVEISADETLLAAVSNAGVAVPVDCGGRGTCGKCLVRLGAGELTAPTQAELKKVPPERLEQGWRLACQAKPLTPLVSVEVRQTGGRRQILTASRLERGEGRLAVRREVVALRPATFEDPRSDLERVEQELGVTDVPMSVLCTLPDLLRGDGFRATITR